MNQLPGPAPANQNIPANAQALPAIGNGQALPAIANAQALPAVPANNYNVQRIQVRDSPFWTTNSPL